MPSSPTGAAAITPLEAAEARASLSQILSSSLDVSDVISHFFQHIQPLLRVGGLRYTNPDNLAEHQNGKTGQHRYVYQLTSKGCPLGEIVFCRDNSFDDDELLYLEMLLTLLTCPLHNALKYERAMALALQDSLTGVGNRAALDNALLREIQLSERYHQPFSLLVIDIDHFKHINDEHGHSNGDQVLKNISRLIQQVCRTSDMVFRYGGEEFVVLLSKTDLAGATTIAERLRKAISLGTFKLGNCQTALTVSIGVGSRRMSQPSEDAESLFERADRALYRAKALGRNCVVTSEDAPASPARDVTPSSCITT
jgi:diguanylate cyclase (GGDEF)-like protein